MQSYPGNHSEQEFVCRSFRNYKFFFLKIKKKKGQPKANPKKSVAPAGILCEEEFKTAQVEEPETCKIKEQEEKNLSS